MKVKFEGVKQRDPTRHEGFKVEYAAAKRAGFRWRWRAMLLLVISPVLIWGWLVFQEEVLTRADGIVTTEPIQLRASKSGFVTDIAILPGSAVTTGQAMFDLSSPEIDRKIQLWQTNLAELKAYRTKMTAELRRVLQAHGTRLEESRAKQDEIAESYRKLAEKGLFTLSDQMQLNEMRRALSDDERAHLVDLERLESFAYTDDLTDEIRAIELEIAVAKVQQSQLNIRADQDGVVNRIFVKQGEYVAEGEPLAEMSNYGSPVVNVYLEPKRIGHAQVNTEVVIVLPDNAKYKGIVSEPPQITETIPGSLAGPFEGSARAIKLIVTFDEVPENWVEGLPVRVRF